MSLYNMVYGMNSNIAVTLSGIVGYRIDERFPGQLDVEDLFTKSTIRAVAAHLEERQHAPA